MPYFLALNNMSTALLKENYTYTFYEFQIGKITSQTFQILEILSNSVGILEVDINSIQFIHHTFESL